MFLLGGPAFCGKTLLALLLNQGSVTCLDEPDFHNPAQRHRGIPLLRRLFAGATFPDEPAAPITYAESVRLLEACERAIHPRVLGIKTAGRSFLEYARIYRDCGYPVIGMIRDIRDVLVEADLPDWVHGEPGLNELFEEFSAHQAIADLVVRYEDLVRDPQPVLAGIARLIGQPLVARASWSDADIHPTMLKLERHDLLRRGRIVSTQVGLWRSATRQFSPRTQRTAALMGY